MMHQEISVRSCSGYIAYYIILYVVYNMILNYTILYDIVLYIYIHTDSNFTGRVLDPNMGVFGLSMAHALTSRHFDIGKGLET